MARLCFVTGLALLLGGPALAAEPSPPDANAEPITHVETAQPVVALTFDACATPGGSYGFDREVFDIVNREHVPMTVFVSGRWVDTHADEMVDMAQDALVEFGNHSYSHPHMPRLPPERIGAEIDRTEAALARYGRHSIAFRPPFGEWDRRMVEVARQRQLPTVTWDVVSGDPSVKTSTAGMVRAVVSQARPGSIIIFHINGRGWKTREALPTILRALRERGLRFVPLSGLMNERRPVTPPAVVAAPPDLTARPPLATGGR
jgi:peptidoglycan/xylan/chitin deacetylase (PgdA/CDA1 family)